MNTQVYDKAKKIGQDVADQWYNHLHGQMPPILQKQNIAGYTRELINAYFQRTEEVDITREKYHQALSEICDLLEKDINPKAFMLALVQIRKIATKAIDRKATI